MTTILNLLDHFLTFPQLYVTYVIQFLGTMSLND